MKKFLSLLLTASMLIAVIPFTALASETAEIAKIAQSGEEKSPYNVVMQQDFEGDNYAAYLESIRNTYDTHLGREVGRYTAGLTWFKKITGLSIDNITYIPGDYSNAECGYFDEEKGEVCELGCANKYSNDTADVNETTLPIIRKCVNNAIKTPMSITQYTE